MTQKATMIAVATAFLVLIAGNGTIGPVAGLSHLSVVGTAEARLGRPLTPVSVAGVARRTVRRCAAGVYYC